MAKNDFLTSPNQKANSTYQLLKTISIGLGVLGIGFLIAFLGFLFTGK